MATAGRPVTQSRRIRPSMPWRHLSQNQLLIVLAVVVGLTTGIGVLIFSRGLDFFTHIFRDLFAGQLLMPVIGPTGIVVTIALGGLLVGLIMHCFVGVERHTGIAGIVESVALAGGRLPYTRMPFKTLATILSLGAGASVGPEAPSVLIGANLGSMFGQILHLTEEHVRLLVAAGSAGAIASVFQAPIAGVFFALEIILRNEFTTSSFGVIVLAAVISSAFTQMAQGAVEPELGIRTYTLGGPAELPLYILLGLLLAPACVLLIRAVVWQHDFWHRVHLSRPLKTALAGGVVGIAAIFFPQIMGTGREFMNTVLNTSQTGEAQFTILFLIAVAVAKILMTSVSLGGGFVGGIFAPSLFIGTMLGGAFGRIVTQYLPHGASADPQAYAIAGMAAVMGGIVRAPITAIMLVFEITNDYHMILPIMLTTVVCVYLTERMQPDNIDTTEMARKGVRLQRGRDVDLMQSVTVAEVMITPAPTIVESASLADLRAALRQFQSRSIVVVNDGGRMTGIVSLSDLQAAYESENGASLTIGDICTREVVSVHADDMLWTAIRVMGAHTVGRVPVIEADGTLVGMLSRVSVVEGYNKAITRKLEHQHNAEQIRLSMLTGVHVNELYIFPGSEVDGKLISEVRWPPESVVATVRRRSKLIVPHGATELRAGDTVTIVSDVEATQQLKALFNPQTLLEM